MKTRVSLALMAALLLALPSCVKAKETTTLKKDGSGKYAMKIVFDMKALDGLKEQFGQMSPDLNESNPTDDMDPEVMKAWLAKHEGVKLVKAEVTEDEENKRFTADLVVEFKTLEALLKTGLIGGGKAEVSLEKTEDGHYVYTRRTEAAERMPDENDEEAQMQMQMFMPMLEPFMKEFEMAQSMTVPGTVVETSATKASEGRGAALVMSWKNLFKKDAHSFSVKFKPDEGVALKPFKLSFADMAKAEEAWKKFREEFEAKKKAAADAAAKKDEGAEKEPAGAGMGGGN